MCLDWFPMILCTAKGLHDEFANWQSTLTSGSETGCPCEQARSGFNSLEGTTGIHRISFGARASCHWTGLQGFVQVQVNVCCKEAEHSKHSKCVSSDSQLQQLNSTSQCHVMPRPRMHGSEEQQLHPPVSWHGAKQLKLALAQKSSQQLACACP